MLPPHLPPPSSTIAGHRRLERLKLILFVTAMSVFAGAAGALIILGWVSPAVIEQYTGGISYNRSVQLPSELSDRVRQDISERVLMVYQSSEVVGSLTYVPVTAKRRPGVLVSSDGWIALYDTSPERALKEWRVVTGGGAVYGVTKILVDAASGLTYAKLSPSGAESGRSQFKVVNFSAPVSAGDTVFISEPGAWSGVVIKSAAAPAAAAVYRDSAPHDFYILAASAAPGAVAITPEGELAGFIRADGTMTLAVSAARALESVLSQERVQYPSLGLEGAYTSDQPVMTEDGSQAGFLVSKTPAASALRRGDLITDINGQVVTPAVLWHTISNKPTTVRIKILRGDKLLELTVPVSAIQ